MKAKQCDVCGLFENDEQAPKRGWFEVAWPTCRERIVDVCSWGCLQGVTEEAFDPIVETYRFGVA